MLQSPCVFQLRGKVLLNSRCLSEAVLSHSRRSRASLGAHYIARYSLCECIGSTFAQNVVGAVDVGADDLSVFCSVQAGSRPDPLPTEGMFLLIACLVIGDRITVKKARLARIALFPDFHPDTDERRFIGQHVNEAAVGD